MFGVNILGFLILLITYIGIPVAIILLLKWIYQIKKNSDYQVEQNNRIIQLLKRMDNES
ncbi:hypothetical protein BN1058_01562 [Paraliobacillus sp. PM-2]|uniref:hypothetical protein n=1 Tax=Paraliobacillus sp. PM-2 TaxID=1462524 RepID=UPI00061C06D0|nr:hypothetical protein [Paraliobacillus sp. PM-2]CQR47255.1 hypothetical protein BN1058_01562 [Paraliobacillus sp. PM-2]